MVENMKFYKLTGNEIILLPLGAEFEKAMDGLTEVLPNTVEAAVEKHIPEINFQQGGLTVQVGSVPHPMIPEHYIQWIYVKTQKGGLYRNLKPGQAPEVTFDMDPRSVTAVYAYCNIHGLWKAVDDAFIFDDEACSAEFTEGCKGATL